MKPTTEKTFSYLAKLELAVLQSDLEKLVEDKYLQTKGSNDNETFTNAKKRHTFIYIKVDFILIVKKVVLGETFVNHFSNIFD